MSPHPDDLTSMKDDMTAFIEGLGMRRFCGYVECEEVPSVLWDSEQNPDGWKDFVELAKSTGAVFLTMHSWTLDRAISILVFERPRRVIHRRLLWLHLLWILLLIKLLLSSASSSSIVAIR